MAQTALGIIKAWSGAFEDMFKVLAGHLSAEELSELDIWTELVDTILGMNT